MYLFEANLNLLDNALNPDVAQYYLEYNLRMPAVFVVDPLVLLKEKYPCNTLQVWRSMPTNAQKVKSAMIALTCGTAFLRFYQKMADKAHASF